MSFWPGQQVARRQTSLPRTNKLVWERRRLGPYLAKKSLYLGQSGRGAELVYVMEKWKSIDEEDVVEGPGSLRIAGNF